MSDESEKAKDEEEESQAASDSRPETPPEMDLNAVTRPIPAQSEERPRKLTTPRRTMEFSGTEPDDTHGVTAAQGPRYSDRDAKLAQLAVESGMASEMTVQICLKSVEEAVESGADKSLGDVLVEKGVLTEGQVQALSAAIPEEEVEAPIASVLGGYEIIEKVGEGGMGTVYKARQIALDRIVALKILTERLAMDAEFVSRLLREAKVVAKLDHQNIVRAIDAGQAEGKYYFAMEFVEGQSLEAVLQKRKLLPEEEALGIIIQSARGLEAAWKSDLVHRDIKPDNILMTESGVVKLADLGLAKGIEADEVTRLTQDGAAMGTPHYMSPEQAKGQDVDIRADIFALGVTFYRMVTGQFPFEGKDTVSIIMARFHNQPELASTVNPDVSEEVSRVIDTMMALQAQDRYPNPAILIHDLDLVAEGKEPEYASSDETARRRAVEAAMSRHVTIVGGIPIIRRRGRRTNWTVVITGAVVAAAMLIAVLMLRGRTPSSEEGTREVLDRLAAAGIEIGPVSEEETARMKALEDEAAALFEELSKSYGDELYDEVAERLESAGDDYSDTSYATRFHSLRMQAQAKIDETARRAAAEAEKQRRHQELVKLAREELAAGDHATALGLLSQAKAMQVTEEIEQLIQEAKRSKYLSRAEQAERGGRLGDAIEFYEFAFQIRDELDLHEHVADLKRRAALQETLEEADGLAAGGEWHNALDAYLKALELANDVEARQVRPCVEKAQEEAHYLDLLQSARTESLAGNWRKVIEAAGSAALMKPDAPEPKDLITQARIALGPEKQITNPVDMEFVLVPAGDFGMGGDGGDSDEVPRRDVRLDDYYIGKFEVTNAQFELFNPAHRHGRTEYSSADDMPVVAVSWLDAVAFCRWLSQREGVEYRLPTEAEWEKAARGCDGLKHPWGNKIPDDEEAARLLCNIAFSKEKERWGEDGFEYAAPVGSYPAGSSPCGAQDMAGNVWEWCLDWYRGDYYSSDETANPCGPISGKQRVLRGGSFANEIGLARCANRTAHEPDFVEASVGFRCVRALDAIFVKKHPREQAGEGSPEEAQAPAEEQAEQPGEEKAEAAEQVEEAAPAEVQAPVEEQAEQPGEEKAEAAEDQQPEEAGPAEAQVPVEEQAKLPGEEKAEAAEQEQPEEAGPAEAQAPAEEQAEAAEDRQPEEQETQPGQDVE